MQGKKNNGTGKVPFTYSESVSLPSEDPMVMGIRSRDWKRLRQSVDSLSADTSSWELVFSVSFAVFLTFILPAIVTDGSGWQLVFAGISLISAGISGTSFFSMRTARERRSTDKKEVLTLMDDIQALYESDTEAPSNATDRSSPNVLDDIDEALYKDAVKLAFELGKMSTSLLQRRMRIGYARAARIMDRMEHEGIVGEPDGSRPREILAGRD